MIGRLLSTGTMAMGNMTVMAERWQRQLVPMTRQVLLSGALLLLAGCGHPTSQAMLNPVPQADPAARTVSLLVATPRGLDRATATFTSDRADVLTFNRLRVAIPSTHKPGTIEWPNGPSDPSGRSFATLENDLIAASAMNRSLDAMVPPSGDVLLFVHGFNTAYEEGVYRLAQLANDTDVKSLPILFSWPSRGDLTDYLTDRESTLASRHHLRHLLESLARHPRVKRIDLMAHSMGTMLAMETLVHLKLAGNAELNNRLNTVVLAAPDIDVDVFRAQFGIIGRRPRPTIVMVSRDDRALALSRRLAGNVVRVGAASVRSQKTIEFAETMGLTVIDLTDVKSEDRSNHTKFAAAPAIVRQLAGQMHTDLHHKQGSAVGTFIVDTAGEILHTPSRLLSHVTGR